MLKHESLRPAWNILKRLAQLADNRDEDWRPMPLSAEKPFALQGDKNTTANTGVGAIGKNACNEPVGSVGGIVLTVHPTHNAQIQPGGRN